MRLPNGEHGPIAISASSTLFVVWLRGVGVAKERDEWTAGYICAVATLLRSHGDGTEVGDVLGCIKLPPYCEIEEFDRESLEASGYISEPDSATTERAT